MFVLNYKTLRQELEEKFNAFVSCKDLEGSIFLRSNEIRACCKRFFVNGEIKGDVVLANYEEDFSKTLIKSEAKRQELRTKLRVGNECECTGCPYLQVFEKKHPQQGISYISVENHSICNLRCSYCSEEYYGGTKETYKISEAMSEILKANAVASKCDVVWGGGEPSIGPTFSEAIDEMEVLNGCFHKFITNAVRYNSKIAEKLVSGKGQVITSIDASCAESFKAVRGRDKFHDVLSNLKQYASINPSLVTIKYIIMDENSSNNSLEQFVDLMLQHGFGDCNFQISCNFKYEFTSEILVKQAAYLFSLLVKNNCKYVYLDDLFVARVSEHKNCLINEPSLKNYLFSSQVYPVNVYGNGQHSLNIFERFNLVDLNRVGYFVVDPEYQSSEHFMGKECRPASHEILSEGVFVAAIHDFSRLRYRNDGIIDVKPLIPV